MVLSQILVEVIPVAFENPFIVTGRCRRRGSPFHLEIGFRRSDHLEAEPQVKPHRRIIAGRDLRVFEAG
jgi:hypothetical protein